MQKTIKKNSYSHPNLSTRNNCATALVFSTMDVFKLLVLLSDSSFYFVPYLPIRCILFLFKSLFKEMEKNIFFKDKY